MFQQAPPSSYCLMQGLQGTITGRLGVNQQYLQQSLCLDIPWLELESLAQEVSCFLQAAKGIWISLIQAGCEVQKSRATDDECSDIFWL